MPGCCLPGTSSRVAAGPAQPPTLGVKIHTPPPPGPRRILASAGQSPSTSSSNTVPLPVVPAPGPGSPPHRWHLWRAVSVLSPQSPASSGHCHGPRNVRASVQSGSMPVGTAGGWLPSLGTSIDDVPWDITAGQVAPTGYSSGGVSACAWWDSFSVRSPWAASSSRPFPLVPLNA